MSSYVYQSTLLECGLYVMTTWHRLAGGPPETRIWDLSAPGPPSAPAAAPLWQRTYRGAVTPGGLAEAHQHVVAQCRRGALTDPGEEGEEHDQLAAATK